MAKLARSRRHFLKALAATEVVTNKKPTGDI